MKYFMQDSECKNGFYTLNENGYVMTIVPTDSNGDNSILTIVDKRNEQQSMLVGTILKVPTNVSYEACNMYKTKMIHLYETFSICSISQNLNEFDDTYNKVA